MSALAVKFPGIGRNFARIFKVYNHLIYWCLQEIRRKIMLFSMFYFLDYIAVPIVMAWFLQPVLVAATLFRQSSHSRYYDWARKKQMYVVWIVFFYLLAVLGVLKFYDFL